MLQSKARNRRPEHALRVSVVDVSGRRWFAKCPGWHREEHCSEHLPPLHQGINPLQCTDPEAAVTLNREGAVRSPSG
jgi:hypothetical protein